MAALTLELPFVPLDVQCQDARSKSISWQSFFEAGAISADEMTVMAELADPENWPSLLAKDGSSCLRTPLDVLAKVEQPDAVLVCLTVFYDVLVKHPADSARILKEIASPLAFEPLRRRILVGDELVAGHAARILAVVALAVKQLPEKDTEMLLEWIDSSFRESSDKEQRILLATLLLEHVLRLPRFRDAFSARQETLTILASSLIRSRNVQIQYQALFAVWLLSFDASLVALLQSRYAIITALLDVAKTALKDKIVRVCISAWRNMLAQCPSVAVPVMIGAKLLEYLESLGANKVADQEVCADVSVLRDALAHAYQSINSYDEYASEIKSGKLEWSPPHKSDLFWRDNAARLQENDCELLRLLAKYLEPETDPKIMAIAASDIGMYVVHHTAGRENVQLIGTKPKIMALISHPDSEVRYQALTAMQKYMKKLWNPA